MKKLYFLSFFLLFIYNYTFSQNIVVNGGFENWTGGVLDTWSSESGTTITENTTEFTEGSSSANFEVTTTTQGDTDFRQSVPVTIGTVYDVSVDIYQVDAFSRARIYADGYQNYSNETLTGQWQTISYEYTATATGNVEFGLRFYDNAGFPGSSTIIVDNYQVIAQSTPTLAITSPTDGLLTNLTDIDVMVSVQNFTVAIPSTGDGYIEYSIDGGSIMDKFDTSTINLTSLSPGVHFVDMELVDNSGNPLSSPVTASVTFTIYEIQSLPFTDHFNYTVSEALAAQDPWTNYFTGDDVLINAEDLSYSTLSGSGNSISFDGGGADPIVDYTATSSGSIYASFMLKVTAFDASPVDGYFAVLRTDGGDYASRLWISPTSTSTYRIGVSNSSTLTQINSPTTDYGLDEVIFVVLSYDIDNDTVSAWINPTLGGSEPVAEISEASGSSGNTFSQFLIRQSNATETPSIVMDELRIGTTWTDVTPATLSNDKFSVTDLKIYPNPTSLGYVNLKSRNGSAFDVSVYDVLGKQVIKSSVTDGKLDVSSLNTGLYIMKISQEEATVTKKLVIK